MYTAAHAVAALVKQTSHLITLCNNLPHRLSHHLMIILLLQPTHHRNTHQPREPAYANRIRTTMNRIIIRHRTTTSTRQRILPHKRRLDLVSPAKTRDHLLPHRPAGHAKAQDRIALPAHPVVVIRERPVVCGALEDDVQRAAAGGGVRQGDGDQRGFALALWEGEDLFAEGGAEGPGCAGCECAEDVLGVCFLGEQDLGL